MLHRNFNQAQSSYATEIEEINMGYPDPDRLQRMTLIAQGLEQITRFPEPEMPRDLTYSPKEKMFPEGMTDKQLRYQMLDGTSYAIQGNIQPLISDVYDIYVSIQRDKLRNARFKGREEMEWIWDEIKTDDNQMGKRLIEMQDENHIAWRAAGPIWNREEDHKSQPDMEREQLERLKSRRYEEIKLEQPMLEHIRQEAHDRAYQALGNENMEEAYQYQRVEQTMVMWQEYLIHEEQQTKRELGKF